MDLACQQAEHAWLLPNGSARQATLQHLGPLEGVPESNAQLALVGGARSQAAPLLREMGPRKAVHARAGGREKGGRPRLLVNLLTQARTFPVRPPILSPLCSMVPGSGPGHGRCHPVAPRAPTPSL